MQRCIQIARNGLGSTAPNPMVGAIIVHNGRIIGEGYTSAYGGAHAEVNAIRSVSDPSLLKASVLYVTLEPCSHFGNTPPCADLIISHGIPEVVIGLADPHVKVAGKGIQRLRDSGCQVTVGVLEQECREHHCRFLTFHEQKRPYIILKWAQTLDGFIAPKKTQRPSAAQPYWITGRYARQMVHRWRSEEQAILVGTTTVLSDNPRLDVRHWTGKNPVRVLLDRNLRIPRHYHVLDGSMATLVISEKEPVERLDHVMYAQLDFSNQLARGICQLLYEKSITSLIVEGGTRTLQTFIDANLWDEARVFTGNTTFATGVKAPHFSGTVQDIQSVANDQLTTYTP